MKQINVGVIGTGWTGGIRANACARSPLIDELHIAEINPDRLAEVKDETDPAFATTDWEELLKKDELDAIVISATSSKSRFRRRSRKPTM
jgi:myo-inositol 2-dehydrogenase/D-chiro-inositol 1-dehydrogenase